MSDEDKERRAGAEVTLIRLPGRRRHTERHIMRRFTAPKPQKKKRHNYGSVTLMMEEEEEA